MTTYLVNGQLPCLMVCIIGFYYALEMSQNLFSCSALVHTLIGPNYMGRFFQVFKNLHHNNFPWL
jgi:hypothetical protein